MRARKTRQRKPDAFLFLALGLLALIFLAAGLSSALSLLALFLLVFTPYAVISCFLYSWMRKGARLNVFDLLLALFVASELAFLAFLAAKAFF